jgi:hypothetical protein
MMRITRRHIENFRSSRSLNMIRRFKALINQTGVAKFQDWPSSDTEIAPLVSALPEELKAAVALSPKSTRLRHKRPPSVSRKLAGPSIYSSTAARSCTAAILPLNAASTSEEYATTYFSVRKLTSNNSEAPSKASSSFSVSEKWER